MDNKVLSLAIITFFTITLTFPLVDYTFNLSENRMTEGQTISATPGETFFERFTTVKDQFNKSFPGRSFLFRTVSLFKYKYLNSSVLPDEVIIGANKELFLSHNKGDIINESIGVSTFSADEKKNIKLNLENKNKHAKHNGYKLFIAIAPNKHSVLTDKLPFSFEPQRKKIHQLKTITKQFENIHFVDLSRLITKNKNKYKVFHTTDNHWNSLGGYFGYQNLMYDIKNKLSIDSLTIIKFRDLTTNNEHKSMIGNSRLLDLPLHESIITYKPSNSMAKRQKSKFKVPKGHNPNNYELRFKSNVNDLKVLVFRDSFCGNMLNYMKESFGEIIFIFDPVLRQDIINIEKPDIVIYERVERSIDSVVNF